MLLAYGINRFSHDVGQTGTGGSERKHADRDKMSIKHKTFDPKVIKIQRKNRKSNLQLSEWSDVLNIYELQYDKTNKMTCAPSEKTLISLGICPV